MSYVALKIICRIRSFVSVLVFPLVTVVLSLLTILEVFTFRRRQVMDRYIYWWGAVTCWLFNVKIKWEGLENLPQESCLYLFNHTSFFDIFAMVTKISHVRFGAKSELFKIPFFGKAMALVKMLPIERGDVEKVKAVYAKAISRMQPGDQFALSPEGGRSSGQKGLMPFKSGPFIFAIQAKIPLCPVVITGAQDVLPKNAILPNADQWQRTITIRFLPMVSVQGMDLSAKTKLQESVRESMSAFLN